MENQRLFLFGALALIVLLIYQAWQTDYGVQPTNAQNQSAQSQSNPPMQSDKSGMDIPKTAGFGSDTVRSNVEAVETAPTISVQTDTLNVEISLLGGAVRSASLRGYPVSIEEGAPPIQILTDQSPLLYVAQSGVNFFDQTIPAATAQFTAKKTQYQLGSRESITVPLVWEHESGITLTKTFTFYKGKHLIEVDQQIENVSPTQQKAFFYSQLKQLPPTESTSGFFIHTYTGGVVSTSEKLYEKVTFENMQEGWKERFSADGWVAMIQHYFLSAWIPQKEANNRFYSQKGSGGAVILGVNSEWFTVDSGATISYQQKLYIGPKIQSDLEALAPGLELTVDYGMLTIIAKPLFLALDFIHDFLGNWGWSIILLTVLIKLAFFKLSEKSYKSMANMRKLAPKLQQLKERFGDDRQKMNQAMMDLYKKEKINPLGGCLPILIQIPVFISLYWMLLESVELRQAPFIFWLNDLSEKDPYFVLPLLMGATMLIQQKLNPAPPDPMQAKVMMMMPIIFTVMFLFFPSGLVLYWVVNNTLSIAQQWVITKRVEAGTMKS